LTASPTEHWIRANGLELLVEDRGSGPVVLLAHGMWCDAGMFEPLAENLARDHRVLVPELRGHGRSEVPASQWRIADLADDLRLILDGLRVPKVLLAGFSMGGMAAVDFALRFPDRLTGLALMGTSAATEEWFRAAEIRILAGLIELTGKPRFLAREAARSTFSAKFRKQQRAVVQRWEHTVQAMSGPALVHALRAVGSRPSLLDRLDEIRTPTVVLTGSSDRILHPRWSRAMARRMPRARLVAWPGAGHAIPMERPADVAAWIRGFETGSFPGDR
jgi:pimeloyl-ACP methyl ester carboxylesterase